MQTNDGKPLRRSKPKPLLTAIHYTTFLDSSLMQLRYSLGESAKPRVSANPAVVSIMTDCFEGLRERSKLLVISRDGLP